MTEKTAVENRRSIRSFVLRQGRMTKAQQLAFETQWEKSGIDFKQENVDIKKIFNNDNQELIVEIGFGNGKSLAQMALENPHKNYLGIEVHKPGVGALLIEVEKNQLTNVKCINHDAIEVLKHMMLDNSIDAVQLFFPDPWPKKKHRKRRIVKQDFLNLLTQKLKSKGYFHMATDWQPYAEDAMEVLGSYNGLLNRAGKNNFSPKPEFRPKTKFEQRGENLGHGVWDLIFDKI